MLPYHRKNIERSKYFIYFVSEDIEHQKIALKKTTQSKKRCTLICSNGAGAPNIDKEKESKN